MAEAKEKEEQDIQDTEEQEAQPASGTPKMFSEEYVKRLRQENENRRKKAAELEAQIARIQQENEDKEKSEVQKATERAKSLEIEIESLKKENERTKNMAEAVGIATKLNFANPALAIKLVNLDDSTSIENQLTQLAEENQYMIRQQVPAAQVPQQPQTPVQPTIENFGGGATASPNNPPRPKFTNEDQIAQWRKQAEELQKQGKHAQAITLFNKAWEAGQVKPGG